VIIVHYVHRLPADYDLAVLRRWLKERGTSWDRVASLYLWQQDKPFRDWLVRGGYKIVTDVIGRAEVETFFALDAFRGKGSEARFIYKDDISISLDDDLTAAFAKEIELAREHSTQPDVISAVAGLDTRNWKFVRVLLSEAEPDTRERGVAHQIAHLSRPMLDMLPLGAQR